MTISITLWIPADTAKTRLYAEAGSSPWAEAMRAIYRASPQTPSPERGLYYGQSVIMTAAQILAVSPEPLDEAAPGLQGRSALAYLRTLDPSTPVVVNVSQTALHVALDHMSTATSPEGEIKDAPDAAGGLGGDFAAILEQF